MHRTATTRLTAVLAATVLTAGAAVAQSDVDKTGWPDSFTVGTGSQGGTYFGYGSGWAGIVAEALGVSGSAEVTGGPMQNMALVHTGDLPFGMTTMGPAAESIAGQNPIAPGLAMDNVCAMFPMYRPRSRSRRSRRPASRLLPTSPQVPASALAPQAPHPTPTSRA